MTNHPEAGGGPSGSHSPSGRPIEVSTDLPAVDITKGLEGRLTFVVFTSNESRRLPYVLRCIQGYGRIVVIDNASTDDTRDIASHFTDEIFVHQNPGFIENQNTMAFALSKVSTPWVYLTYVDELLPQSLLRVVAGLAMQDTYKLVEIHRKDFMYGQEIYNYGGYHLRMFVPGSVDFTGNIVHKFGRYCVSSGEVYRVAPSDKTSIWHFSSYNTSALELSHNRYATLEATQRGEIRNEGFAGFRAIWKPLYYFFGSYLGLGGFRGGWPGLFISVQRAYLQFSIQARLWERGNSLTLDSIESRYEAIKERLLAERQTQ